MDEPFQQGFGRIVVEPARRRLVIDGEPAKIGARAFDLLMALIDRRDRVVSKDQLLDIVWPNVTVEEGNLQVQIATLRKLLGAEAIATVPGQGYRFVAPNGVPQTFDERPASAPEPPMPTAAKFWRARGAAGSAGTGECGLSARRPSSRSRSRALGSGVSALQPRRLPANRASLQSLSST